MNTPFVQEQYDRVISRFDEQKPGRGLELVFKGLADQPMTYGLLLASEAAYYRKHPNEVTLRRARLCAEWLTEHADLNQDGIPGWGLPHASDAFSDGSINPANHPYSITTSIVIEGFLEALSTPSLIDVTTASHMKRLLLEVSLFWCQEVWSDRNNGGYFWYSPLLVDSHFTHNASAMLTGALSRMLKVQSVSFSSDIMELVQKRVDASALAIIDTVKITKGLPSWPYAIYYDPKLKWKPNDLLHHCYILWGMESYRANEGKHSLPWTTAQALDSISQFEGSGVLYEYPRHLHLIKSRQTLSRLWGSGAALAFQATYGKSATAENYMNIVLKQHGDAHRLFAIPGSGNTLFYPRHAAHFLWGLSKLLQRNQGETAVAVL